MGFWSVVIIVILAVMLYRIYQERKYILALGVLTERTLGIKESIWTKLQNSDLERMNARAKKKGRKVKARYAEFKKIFRMGGRER